MDAIRRKVKRTGNKVIIELPEDFIAETFELILFPVENNPEDNLNEANEWKNFSIRNLDRLYKKNKDEEPDYSRVLVKEPNVNYKL